MAMKTSSCVQSGDQLKQLKDIFTRFDMDSDGSLTQLELAALLRSLGLKPSGDQIHTLLADMDANGNGSVVGAFKAFDRDGNGSITAAELAGTMAKLGHPLTFRELSEMMREADSNGDGVLSFNEFANIMARSAADFLGLKLKHSVN
ncbi:putative calcium-binding protein CML16 [Hibiscus syriacus]|uniref:Calcium-binding protein CML16 n=1 Tax=Hibiscus syriacus TaxID=106335 RepID=A0A6A2XVH6_HIBSY|nr:putative calcium-binding protein CML16 [Hibiscus syriacus]